jgi:proline dehydrogenase
VLRFPLLRMARSDLLRRVAGGSGLARRIAYRYVAGETPASAIGVSRRLNEAGLSAEIDYLGENVRDADEARSACRVYTGLLEGIEAAGVGAEVSLKLTQMGLDIDFELCRQNVQEVVERAAALGNFVWLDMESSDYTDRTLHAYMALRARNTNVGVAVQSALYRSKEDVRSLLDAGGTVRLCKGAYLEPASIAYQRKRDVDRSFAMLAEMLLASGRRQAIATHDDKLIKYTIRHARSLGIDQGQYEFQMLHGVRRDLQKRLVREGFNVRVYVPFGKYWYPYLMRRLAERPANLMFFASSIVREAGSRE